MTKVDGFHGHAVIPAGFWRLLLVVAAYLLISATLAHV